MKLKVSFTILGLLLAAVCYAQAVTITSSEGVAIEVEILQIEPTRIEILMANGQKMWLERNRLSDASQAMILDRESKDQDAYLELNQLLGIELFKDGNLWDEQADAVAKRLAWPNESETDSQSSYRYYPRTDYQVLESRAYSAVLYGANDKAERLSIVFANKGDFAFSTFPTESEIEAMDEAIEKDVDHIEKRLTQQLGEPTRQQFGSGRGIKQRIQRWDWNTHAFLLAYQEGEYVSLQIISTAAADNKGRPEKLSDSTLRKLTIDNIVTRPNGDVVLSNIPMVNQGPKGYCVPATFERYLRYMQIPADMYILAMAGQTEAGGGTAISEIIASIDGYISSQSRSMKELKEPIKLRTVQKYIDKGLPIIWTMYSSTDYNELANSRSIKRLEVTDWNAWADATTKESRAIELRKEMMSSHACMIIGYNKETGEIAVSDSWGPRYEERWIPVEQADQVSQGSIYLIEF